MMKNSETAVLEKLREIIANELKGKSPQIDADSPLTELGLDSLDIISITDAVETEFDIRFDDSDFASVATVGELQALTVKYIAQR